MTQSTTHNPKLSKAPLREVYMEVFWELDVELGTPQPLDKEFDLAQGLMATELRKELPYYERVAQRMIPQIALNHKPIHRFRPAINKWPVVQFGPGMMSVHENDEGYVWEPSFKRLIYSALDILQNSYSQPRKFIKVTLRYVDADKTPSEEGSFLGFIENNLQVRVDRKFNVPGELTDLNLTEVYKQDDGSRLYVGIANGKLSKSPSPDSSGVIWQTGLILERKLTIDEIKGWLVHAHSVISDLFTKMLSRNYYESLR